MNDNKEQLEFKITLTADELAKALIGHHVKTNIMIRGTSLEIYVAIK